MKEERAANREALSIERRSDGDEMGIREDRGNEVRKHQERDELEDPRPLRVGVHLEE